MSYTVVFGGSFNPPHLCHANIALAIQQNMDVEEMIVTPSGDHPEKENGVPFGHRFNMCKKAFSTLRNVKVSNLEDELPSPTYTYNTLEKLDEEGYDDLAFVIGSDLVHDIPAWERGEEIQELATFIVVPRQGYPITSIPDEVGDHEMLEVGYDIPQLSSTYIRKILRNGGNAFNLLDNKVARCIYEHQLYQ